MTWTPRQIRYLDEHAQDGAEKIAKALGMTVNAVQIMVSRRGLSLKKRWVCPKCGSTTTKPLNSITGWCPLCVKKERVRGLRIEAQSIKDEARVEEELNKEANRYYNQKLRAKKKL